MVKLFEGDVATKEVLAWRGLHLVHFNGSSCSQKTRIFLNLKQLDWQSHHLDLVKQKNYSDWFLGINPRGLVPVLVHDGDVHIESNDILTYLENTFPKNPLMPVSMEEEIALALKEEDDLHLDIRALSMRFVFSQKITLKNPKLLANYQNHKGTIQGVADSHKKTEIDYWQTQADTGICDAQVKLAASRFRAVYDKYDENLTRQRYFLGDELTLVDIAWYIYTNRLVAAKYPFAQLHPNVWQWYQGLDIRPEFSKEVKPPFALTLVTKALHFQQRLSGKTLSEVAGF